MVRESVPFLILRYPVTRFDTQPDNTKDNDSMPLAGEVIDLHKHYHLKVASSSKRLLRCQHAVSARRLRRHHGLVRQRQEHAAEPARRTDRPTSGEYILGGHHVSELSDDDLSHIRNQLIGFIFQSFNLIPQYTVLENVQIPLHYRPGRPALSARDIAHCVDLCEQVGLGDRIDHRPYQLSGGQQQRVAIARALANDPEIILADEPTGNLDSKTGEEIMGMLRKLNAEGRTILMVTHENEIAAQAKRQIHMKDGVIAGHGIFRG